MAEAEGTRFPAGTIEAQISAILAAWGMAEEHVAITTRIMLAADLRGIDSHGLAMLPLYEEHLRNGKITMRPQIRVVRESPVTALIDGGGGLGHVPSDLAMRTAIDKAKRAGLAAVGVRNSAHYGAAGIYALMAAQEGLIGLSTTAVWKPSVVPTFAAEPMFGTNPIAFAAPAGRYPPFVLDMATSTVAIGKLKIATFAGKPLPLGWVVDAEGKPVTDPHEALRIRSMTPLGGTPEMSSHKGYGLGAMVEILSTTLTGAAFAPLRQARDPDAARHDVGQFFMAIDPKAFRDEGEFEADLDEMIDALHAARRADPYQPVLVAGEPEERAVAERAAVGIPVPDTLRAIVAGIARRAGAAMLL
jgi:LDH2 family malate/lactate/ureidoglycolate dehydrogenase